MAFAEKHRGFRVALADAAVGRVGGPEELARCVRLFLHSLSVFFTGEIRDLNGGHPFRLKALR